MERKILRELLGEPVGTDLAEIFPNAMDSLTHPAVESSLALRVDAWERSLLAARPHASTDAANCIRAGLRLLAGDMDTAHRLCQDVHTSLGSAWHAHLHRREPDFANAMYWWRRVSGLTWALPGTSVGELVAARLKAATLPPETETLRGKWAAKLARGVYDPADFVSAVQAATESRAAEPAWLETLRDIQRAEWLGLMYESLRQAG